MLNKTMPENLLPCHAHPSWDKVLTTGLSKMNQSYLHSLANDTTWLPGKEKIFNAFSLPLSKVRYVLLGESPYPRKQSANGYAFWDAAVNNLWSSSGLSKEVNRATSLRNMIKMLLIAEGLLSPDNTTQEAISAIGKQNLIQTNNELFINLINHGFILLNATPVLSNDSPAKDARLWQPFLQDIMINIFTDQPQATLLLFGKIAQKIEKILPQLPDNSVIVEHPYNVSFITNPEVIRFFKPLHLLRNTPSTRKTSNYSQD